MKPRPPAGAPSASAVPARLRPHLARLTSFLIVFAVGYSLGLLSSSTRPSPRPSQTTTVTWPHAAHLADASSAVPAPNGTGVGAAASSYPRSPPHDQFRFKEECGEPVPGDAVVRTLLDKLFDGESPYAGFPPAHAAALLHPVAARPRGWGSRGAVFAELIAAVRPAVIVELGAFLGASALHMAAVSRNLSLAPAILCVDDFRGWPGFRDRFRRDVPPQRHGDALLLPQFMANVAAAGGDAVARVLPLPFSTASALAALCDWGVYAELIEVDAGHDFHSAWADINLAWAVLRPGGVMFGHDYFTAADDRGVRRAACRHAVRQGQGAHRPPTRPALGALPEAASARWRRRSPVTASACRCRWRGHALLTIILLVPNPTQPDVSSGTSAHRRARTCWCRCSTTHRPLP